MSFMVSIRNRKADWLFCHSL